MGAGDPDGSYFGIGTALMITNTGTITKSTGTGLSDLQANLSNDGTDSVASGILKVSNYTQTSSGTLRIEVGGPTPGTQLTQR